MNTYFITYNTGQYDSYERSVYAFDAESKDVIMDEVVKQIHVFHKLKSDYELAKEKEVGSYPNESLKEYSEKVNKYYAELIEFIKVNGYEPCYFHIFNYVIKPFDDIMEYYPDINEISNRANFEIYDVEEYIDTSRPRKVE